MQNLARHDASSRRESIDGFDVLALMLPLLGLLKIDLVGQLYVHEMILLILFIPINLKYYRTIYGPATIAVTGLAVLWLLGQALTDWIRATPFEDYARGWAKIIFFTLSFLSLRAILSNERRIIVWVAVSTIPIALRPFENFDYITEPEIIWKFGMGQAFLMLCSIPIFVQIARDPNNLKNHKRLALVYLVVGIGSFFANARSLAGTTIFTALLILAFAKYRGRSISFVSAFALMILAVVTINAVAYTYSWGSSSGAFGPEAQLKYDMQGSTNGGVLDLLLGGRSEALVSVQAIEDSPIVGHGSWAKGYQYQLLLVDMKRRFSSDGEPILLQDDSSELIPTHSYLLGSWVEAGILGALFWSFIIGWSLTFVLPKAIARGDVIGLIVVVSITSFFWNILFSPFGANVRVEAASIIAIFCHIAISRSESWARQQ